MKTAGSHPRNIKITNYDPSDGKDPQGKGLADGKSRLMVPEPAANIYLVEETVPKATGVSIGAFGGLDQASIDQMAAMFANITGLTVTIDSIIYEDGLILGPDKGQQYEWMLEQGFLVHK